MYKRRSILNLIGKITFFTFFLPNFSSATIIPTKKNKNYNEIDINIDLINQTNPQFFFKMNPGEKIQINFISIKNDLYFEKIKGLTFKMPLVSLRPYFFFFSRKKNLNSHAVVFSARGLPLKET